MEMTGGGRISPTGGRTGHLHDPEAIGAQETPTAPERAAIEAATTVADLKTALLAWIDSQ